MTSIYTKNGRPLRRDGDDLFARSGAHVARLRGDRAFDSRGQYVGTLVGDRLIYRSTQNAAIGPPFMTRPHAGSTQASRVATAQWGDEPPIPD